MASFHADTQFMVLDDLAEELTRRLSIPFKPGPRGTVVFRQKLRITDWAVPLIFDGHARREREAVIPTDFVGHALWPTLKASRPPAGERRWWQCEMPAGVARAIVESMQDEDEHPLDDGVWRIGMDVLLEHVAPPKRTRRRAA